MMIFSSDGTRLQRRIAGPHGGGIVRGVDWKHAIQWPVTQIGYDEQYRIRMPYYFLMFSFFLKA
ncbi:MAG: hypothetical protein M3Y65_24725 [Pseudomonadota bacterium]|nr:hypothetical protein [Pseudomonadota bacterium]